jgi:protein-S-isoprenylcysteine O-methyltransferase Ste14
VIVSTLGRSFSTFIQVDADQAVVTGGRYRWGRHPCYTGLLLTAPGMRPGRRQLAVPGGPQRSSRWWAVARIAVEEAELARVPGDQDHS